MALRTALASASVCIKVRERNGAEADPFLDRHFGTGVGVAVAVALVIVLIGKKDLYGTLRTH